MRHLPAVLALGCCLLVAGCSGLGPIESNLDKNPSSVESGPPYPDPWPGSPTVVAINATATEDRAIEPIVESALSYWNTNDERYGTYTTTFELRPDAQDPDVVIEFVPKIEECGHVTEETTVGCAPLLSNQSLADRPTTVRVETGYTDESTGLILKHELGHVLGLEHGDEPTALMSTYTNRLNTPPKPDVFDRELTWKKANLTLYADRDSLPGSDTEIDRQIGHAIDYYESGADETVPKNVTLTRIDDREMADIVITGRQMDAASNATLNGASQDADPEIEYYTDQTITISTNSDPETLGWHVGFWLGESLIAPETHADLPPPFDEPETDDRREWW